MNTIVLAISILFVIFYAYLIPMSIVRRDFVEHQKSSFVEILASTLGALFSIGCLVANAVPNIPDYVFAPLFSICFSFLIPLYAVIALCYGLKFKEQILKNKIIDITTKIIAFIFCGSGIILGIVLGRFV